MSLWEFNCCVIGVLESKGAKVSYGNDIDEERLRKMGVKGF